MAIFLPPKTCIIRITQETTIGIDGNLGSMAKRDELINANKNRGGGKKRMVRERDNIPSKKNFKRIALFKVKKRKS